MLALNNKGIVLSNQGKVDDAMRYFDEALAIDPKNDSILNNKKMILKLKKGYNTDNISSQGSSQGSTTKGETTELDNSTYNISMALGKEAKFLYSAVDTTLKMHAKTTILTLKTCGKL
ncbi:MAG TPA: tetratricopeptide repeat protein [Nitrososphaera sp.]|nr:tetratricopeptide repeat protein [Nitrososphaera sp.]